MCPYHLGSGAEGLELGLFPAHLTLKGMQAGSPAARWPWALLPGWSPHPGWAGPLLAVSVPPPWSDFEVDEYRAAQVQQAPNAAQREHRAHGGPACAGQAGTLTQVN